MLIPYHNNAPYTVTQALPGVNNFFCNFFPFFLRRMKCNKKGFPQASLRKTFFILLLIFAVTRKLFKVNFCTFSFKFSFEFFSFCFRASFFNNLWSTVNNFFSFFKSKTSYFTNDFDNFNFRCTSVY